MLLVTSSCAAAQDAAQPDFEPVTPGMLTVAATLPAPGFWPKDSAANIDGGFEWAIATELADQFDLQLRVIDVPFESIVSGDLGGADLAMSQISVTGERSDAVDFSVPYYATSAGVLRRSGEDLTDLKTAREERWAVLGGTTHAAFIEDVIRPDDEVLVLSDNVACAEAVADGSVDAALFDLTTSAVLEQQVTGVDTVARFDTDEFYAIAFPNGSANVELVDAAVRGLDADDSLQSFIEEWLDPVIGADVDRIPVIRTSP